MRTTIDINDKLLQTAMEISHVKTKKAVVELALREYVNRMRRTDLVSLSGQVEWDGDLNQMRTNNLNAMVSHSQLLDMRSKVDFWDDKET